MNEKEMVTCPMCGGSGKLRANNEDTPYDPYAQHVRCWTCKGEGKIPKK